MVMTSHNAFQALPQKPETFQYIPTEQSLGTPIDPYMDLEFVCALEWALSPGNTRVDGFYFGQTQTHWHLFSLVPDPETSHWGPLPLGTSLRGEESAETACVWLLLSHLVHLDTTSHLGSFEFVQDAEYLSEETIWLIAEYVWG